MAEDAEKKENFESENLSKVEKQLTKVDPKVFDGITEEKKQQIIESFVVISHNTYAGPLPDVETLTGYAALIPNGADRIMKMAEKQLDHRIDSEKKIY